MTKNYVLRSIKHSASEKLPSSVCLDDVIIIIHYYVISNVKTDCVDLEITIWTAHSGVFSKFSPNAFVTRLLQ